MKQTDGYWYVRNWPGFLVGSLILVLVSVVCLAYIRAGYAAFTSFKFTLTDYGRYVNTIWNCAHGDPFRLLNGFSYLNTHLSFSLYLLAPAFWIWDHPFSLWLYQFFLCLIGLAVMGLAARRQGVPYPLVAVLLFLYLVNPFTQTVLLSEFHGVNLYLFLMPCLYYTLVFQRRFAWIPLLLVWGVREEAAFLVIPMLLYFAVRERWKTGYLMAGISALYGLFACTVLFEWINGFSLKRQRPDVGAAGILGMLGKIRLVDRLAPTGRLFLPVVPFLRSGWEPIMVFPLVALLFTLASPYPAQYGLKYHYPAAPLILLMLGLLHAIALRWREGRNRMGWVDWAQVVFLFTLAMGLHAFYGLLPAGRYSRVEYQKPSITGQAAVCMAAHVPKSGILLTDRRLSGLTANRRDLSIWELYQPEQDKHPDLILAETRDVLGRHANPLQNFLMGDSYGVAFFNGESLLLAKGGDPNHNSRVLSSLLLSSRTVRLAYTRKKGGREALAGDCRVVRYWPGKKGPGPILVAYGRALELPAGRYRVRFRLRSQCRDTGSCGSLRIVERRTQTVLAAAPVRHSEGYQWQEFDLDLDKKTRVEPQVLGQNGALWLDQVKIVNKMRAGSTVEKIRDKS